MNEKDKDFAMKEYTTLRDKMGKPPDVDEFYKSTKFNYKILSRIFGRDPFSKLQTACGDDETKLNLKRTSIEDILIQWGNLVKEIEDIPIPADWDSRSYRPTSSGLSGRPHFLKFSAIPDEFKKYAIDKPEWSEVLKIIQNNPKMSNSNHTKFSSDFQKIINAVDKWKPQRRRNSEGEYKVELRSYLQKDCGFTITEESGETNIDILVNNKYPIELKKDPQSTEFDRLFGQLARHSDKFGPVIAVICNVSSQDRLEFFNRLIDKFFGKLAIDIVILQK